MPTDHRDEPEGVRHSAFEEFRRDERRPAVLLLAVLLVAAAFFALGIMVGRWTAADARGALTPHAQHAASPTN
jgi:hypothetical protein